MRPILDTDGENRAVRMFLALYGGQFNVTTKQMKSHLRAAGYNGAWPEWVSADDDRHLTKAGAQSWLRHLFALEQNVDTSEERVHISDKNVHVGWAPGGVVRLLTLEGAHVGNAVIGQKGPANAT